MSDLLPSLKWDLNPPVDVDYVPIVREKSVRLNITVKQVNISAAIPSQGTENDPLLEKRDQILDIQSSRSG